MQAILIIVDVYVPKDLDETRKAIEVGECGVRADVDVFAKGSKVVQTIDIGQRIIVFDPQVFASRQPRVYRRWHGSR
jgi:hypothetical protein